LTSAGAALLFLLFTIVYALCLVMPSWAAGLIVGSVLAVFAALLQMAGVRRFKLIHPSPNGPLEP
jgi:cytochrome c biogenesis protein CcdA